MFSLDEKLEYFINIEKQINAIIEINHKYHKDKIMGKINELIKIQNDKCSLILIIENSSDNYFNLTLHDMGLKIKSSPSNFNLRKIFETKISIKSITRGIRLNIIRNKVK